MDACLATFDLVSQFDRSILRYNPISEKDYLEIFRHVYDPDAFDEPIPAHDLGVLCIVLAIGTLVDLKRPAHSPEAMAFYHLARGAISIDSVLEEQSITAIQALVSNLSSSPLLRSVENFVHQLLICHFMFLSEISSPRWAIMGMVVKLAQSVSIRPFLLLFTDAYRTPPCFSSLLSAYGTYCLFFIER